jgi:SAM-dependent methyltransferase
VAEEQREGPGWWEELYDDLVAELFLVRAEEETRRLVGFLTAALDVEPGARVFDQCCGIGSLGVPLARRGASVVGVDQSGPYIRRARESAAGTGAICEFHRGDAFAFVTASPCDAAFNWGTSFGNAATDSGNAAMLRRAFESLRPGGRFVLDFQHVARVIGDFRECILRRHETDSGEVLLLRESTLDLEGGFLRQVWTISWPDGRRTIRRTAVRLYLPHALGDLLLGVGFVGVEFFGGLGFEPLTASSPRCIVRARRPLR